jgi:hypothetical protein
MAPRPIETEEDWERAQTITPQSQEQKPQNWEALLDWLPYNSRAYLAIRARDNAGQWSPLAESLAFALRPVKILVRDDNDSLDHWHALSRDWGLTEERGVTYLSDSPEGSYRPNSESIAETKDFRLGSSALTLDLRSRYELEEAYDFAYIELSKDQGKSWIILKSLTGKSDLAAQAIDLEGVLAGATEFRLRLRMWTDSSENLAGWDIDSFQILQKLR